MRRRFRGENGEAAYRSLSLNFGCSTRDSQPQMCGLQLAGKVASPVTAFGQPRPPLMAPFHASVSPAIAVASISASSALGDENRLVFPASG
jgi:hypothetical protein